MIASRQGNVIVAKALLTAGATVHMKNAVRAVRLGITTANLLYAI